MDTTTERRPPQQLRQKEKMAVKQSSSVTAHVKCVSTATAKPPRIQYFTLSLHESPKTLSD